MIRLKSTLLKTLLASSIYLLAACVDNPSTAPAAPRGDVILSEFYVPPATLPDEPGVLIRQEELTDMQSLSAAEHNIRILYSSTEGLRGQNINAISGALYLPEGTPPNGGWPLLVWSHGTVGIGDICAPSHAERSERDRTYLNPWLKAGYAIAASDYQGLGTPGTHPYMDSRTMAHNNLDLVRAIQAANLPVSQSVVITGQSQGASAAIATAGFAKAYAPEIDLRGIIATGIPYFSRKIVMDLARNTDPDAVNATLALALYMLTLTEMVDSDFSLDAVLSEDAKPIVSQIGNTCVFDFISKTRSAGLSSRKTFSKRTEFAQLRAFKQMSYPTLALDIPVFTGTGTSDKITPYDMQQAFIVDACKAGSNLTIHTYDGANHNQGLLRSTADAMTFAEALFDGEEPSHNCPK